MNIACVIVLLPLLSGPSEVEGEEPAIDPALFLGAQDDAVDVRDDVAASTFDYHYVEAAAVFGDLDGLRVGASFPLEGPWIALGRIEYLSDDDGAADVDLLLLSGGAGYVHPVRDDLDFVGSAELEYGEVEVDNPGNDVEDDDLGVRLRAGLRHRVTEELELAGGATIRTVFDEDVGLDAMALYSFTDSVQGFVGLDVQDDTFAVVGVRFGL